MSQIAVRTFHDIRAALLARRELALLDVREEDPFAQAHPLFAANLPLSRLELEIHARVPRRDTPITVYDDGEGLRRSPRNASSTSATATWPCSMAACPVGATPAASCSGM